MTFNYFNPGRTGWGKKISGVFNTLEMLGNAAEERIVEVSRNTDFYLQSTNRNYRAPEATRPDLPSRVEDGLDAFAYINRITSIKQTGGNTTFTVLIHDSYLGRPIIATGTTSLKSGNVYYRAPNGNNNLSGTLRITDGTSDTELYTETRLFSFKILDGELYLDNIENLSLGINGHHQYSSLSLTRVGTNSYTAQKEYECVMVNGGDAWFELILNNVTVFKVGSLQFGHPYVTLYLKKGDTVRGSNLTNIYRVNYNR
ncbi:MAG: hypothetical protein NC218_08260 [Acetobacter sp.]|nr:hypothetical protein [Acetobacter sp.]